MSGYYDSDSDGDSYPYYAGYCVCADTEESERSSQSKDKRVIEVTAPRAGGLQEWSFKESHEERDKQSGGYARATAKDIISIGQAFKERSTGRVGIKNEVKSTSTFRVGDKTGYAEYQIEERLKRVDFGGATSNKK